LLLFTPGLSAGMWTEYGMLSGSNNFLRQDLTFALNISTPLISGINTSVYKIEKKDSVISLRLPVSFMFNKNLIGTVKPFYYPKNSNSSSAKGLRASISYLTQNAEKEINTNYNLAISYEDQHLGEEQEISAKALDFQMEKNFYDNFFILIGGGLVNNNSVSKTAQKRFSEISDILYTNSMPFFDDNIYSNMSLQVARSFKPDYDSFFYLCFERLNGQISDYNSYIAGLRINFMDKNFVNFSYNYLDKKAGNDKKYYKVNIGVSF